MGMLAKRRRQSSPIIRLMEVGQVCDNYQTIMMVKVHDYIAINGFAGFTWRQLDRVNLQAMWRIKPNKITGDDGDSNDKP